MKKSFYIPLALAFLLLFCWSCQDEPTAVQNDLSYEQGSEGLAKGKPPAGAPLACLVKLTTPRGDKPSWPVELPGSSAPLMIHYEVSGPNPITQAQIMIVYDEDGDGLWSVRLSERVLIINLQFNGIEKSVTGDIPWNGEVNEMHSDDGCIFDHCKAGQEVYLFPISGSDGRNSANNWGSSNDIAIIPEDARAYVTPLHTTNEFHVAAITIVPTHLKGKYVADLKANVLCESFGDPAIEYIGHGKWVQVLDGSEVAPQLYYGTLDGTFYDSEDGMSTAGPISVGAGKYRFYVTLLWSRHFSYQPSGIYGEVTVP
jgi:hypothetical protein